MLAMLHRVLGRRRDQPIANRRKSERIPCDIPAWLFDVDGVACSATILDRSEGGVRVECVERDFHPRALYLLRSDTGAAYRLRRAWCSREVGGYEFKGRVDGAPVGGEHALNALRVTWAEYQASVRL